MVNDEFQVMCLTTTPHRCIHVLRKKQIQLRYSSFSGHSLQSFLFLMTTATLSSKVLWSSYSHFGRKFHGKNVNTSVMSKAQYMYHKSFLFPIPSFCWAFVQRTHGVRFHGQSLAQFSIPDDFTPSQNRPCGRSDLISARRHENHPPSSFSHLQMDQAFLQLHYKIET